MTVADAAGADDARRSKMRRLKVLGVAEKGLHVGSGLAALGLAALVSLRALTPVAPEQKKTVIYSPLPVEMDGIVVESESKADGFILIVETSPEGADVLIDGSSRGESPASINLDCLPGAPVSLELRYPGFATLRRTVMCKLDVMQVMRARLEKKP